MGKKHLSSLQIIALGYFLVILTGTFLLMSPLSSKGGNFTSFTDALFTAASAYSTTGLILFDTQTYWSGFGLAVILILIQLGGLGVMAFSTFLFTVLKKRIGLRERTVMNDSINKASSSGIIKLTKKMIIVTFAFESIGAALLSIRFVKQFGFVDGIWKSVFISVSSFCNAGFDVMGNVHGEYASLIEYTGDPLVNIVVMGLIVIGGLGFMVWDDILTHKLAFRKYSLASKIVFFMTAILIFGGALLYFIFEYNNMEGLTLGEKILAAFFSSITPRSTGFNTIDTAALTPASKLLTMVLMFIGAGTGSTAGGIKVTTAFIMIAYPIASFRKKDHAVLWGRAIDNESVQKALTVFTSCFGMVIISAFIIAATQNFSLTDTLFETISAFSTAGMTTGVTRDLNVVSKYIIAFLMYYGRVGSTSFAIALIGNKAKTKINYPTESVAVG